MALFLAIVLLLSLVGLFVLVSRSLRSIDATELERSRIEMEVRKAERRLHEAARQGFEAMLAEARSSEYQN